MPQHSFGASSSAWATISSTRDRAIRKLLGARGLGRLELGDVVIVVVRPATDARDRVLELAHPLAERAPDLGQSLRPEEDQGEDQDDEHLGETNAAAEHETQG